jgi:hypothetical protein
VEHSPAYKALIHCLLRMCAHTCLLHPRFKPC